MPIFSRESKDNLAGVDRDLQRLFQRVILGADCTIMEGRRSAERQQQLVAEGKSKTLNSKHLTGKAVDVAPYWSEAPHIRWPGAPGISPEETIERWRRWSAFGGYVRGIADMLNIKVRWGQDWNGDWNFSEHKFIDSPHWELVD